MNISLITCTYNTGKYLRRCFDSIIKQNYDDFEVIVIDDGSTDDSKKIIDEYVQKDKRFVSIFQEHKGQAVARNNGIEHSKGKYIVFVDSDDELKSNYLSSLATVIDRNLEFGFSRMERVYEKKQNFFEKRFKYIHFFDKESVDVYSNPESITKISNSPCAKIFKKDFLINNKIMFFPDKLYEDLLFVVSVLLSNPNMAYIDESNYIYHIRNGTSMTSNGARAFEMLDVFDAVLNYADSKGVLERFREELEYLAIYHIAIGTMYRSFCYKPLSFFSSLEKCRKYLSSHDFSIKNKYVKNMSVFVKTYLFLFFR